MTLEIRGLSSDDIWDFENGFYWFKDGCVPVKELRAVAVLMFFFIGGGVSL